MFPASVIGFLLLLAAVGAPGTSPKDAAVDDLGLIPFPGAVPQPELSGRLDSLRTIRWTAAGVFAADAPLETVLSHLRDEQRKREKRDGPALPGGRLREWLEKNPEELARYREFERRERPASGPAPWEISTIPASEIPLSIGGGDAYRAPRFSSRRVTMAFGSIAFPDAVVRVQLLSPRPTADGRDLAAGTLIALIREGTEPTAASAPALETVDGPETPGLASRVSGWLVMDQPVGGIVALAVPGRERRIVRGAGQSVGVVHTLAGPDDEGRVAYFENRPGDGQHALKLIGVDGSDDRVVFSRPGEAFFEFAVGSSLALSPRGGRIAFLGKLSRFETNRPSFPLRVGRLEIWDDARKSGRPFDLLALDRRLSWFPDGRRLAYVELVPNARAVLPPNSSADRFGDSFRNWEAVPVVRVLDSDTDRRSTLHAGWDPVVSTDGKSVLLRDADNHWRRVDVETGRSEPVRWPGDSGGALALTADGLVLYWGLPTTGTAPEFTRTYSAALGPRPMKTIKVAELSSQRFQTLLPSLDPRRELSFGFVSSPLSRLFTPNLRGVVSPLTRHS